MSNEKLDSYERILRVLSDAGKPLTQRQIEEQIEQFGVPSKKVSVRTLLQKLVDDGLVRIVTASDGATARRHYKLAAEDGNPLPEKKTTGSCWTAFSPAEKSIRKNFAALLTGDADTAFKMAAEPLHFSAIFGGTGIIGYAVSLQHRNVSVLCTVLLDLRKRIRAITFCVASGRGAGAGVYYARRYGYRGGNGVNVKKHFRTILKAHLGEDAVV